MRVRLMMIGLAAVFAAACGSSSSTPTNPSPPSGGGSSSVSIVSGASTMTSTAYNPNPVNVSVGTTITWVNNDSAAHTATGNNGSFDTGTIPAGGRASKVFNSAGTFNYTCLIHPNMVGTITVQ